MLQILVSTLIVLVPLCVAHRGARAGASFVFNFTLYPLIFSYFYLLVPSLIPFVTTLDKSLALSSDSFDVVDFLGVWSVAVFLFAYLMSFDRALVFNASIRFSSFTLSVARVLQVGCACVLGFILARHGAALYSLSGDRALSYEYYAKEIIDVYRLPTLFSFCATASSLMYFRRKNLVELSPLVLFVILDGLQGGRGYTFAALMVGGFDFLAANMRKFKRVMISVLGCAVVLFASAFVRRFLSTDDTSDALVVFFGEFFFTRLTAQFAFDNMSSHGDLLTYMAVSVSKLFPQFLVAPIFKEEDLVPYHVILNDWVGAGFGLAGSIMTEAIYYGGVGFAVVSPVVVAAIFYSLQRSKIVLGLAGYLFFVSLSSSMYLIFRTGFYTNFFSLIYVFVFYLSILIAPSYKARVFFLAGSRK